MHKEKQPLLEKPKEYNEFLAKSVDEAKLANNFAARVVTVEDIICQLGWWEEYLRTYRKQNDEQS